MKTRCPQCHKIYEIDESILEQACQRLVCGRCQTVFDASEHQVNIEDIWGQDWQASPPQKGDPLSELDTQLLVSNDDIPEEMRHLRAQEVPPELLQAEEPPPEQGSFSIIKFLLSLLLILLALLQLAVIYRQPLSQYAEFDALQNTLCQYFNCRPDLNEISLEKKSDHYQLIFELFNRNLQAQPAPQIELSLWHGEQLLARRILQPSEYGLVQIAPRQRQRVELDLQLPDGVSRHELRVLP